jgi:glucans biosynthesis protein
MSSIDRRAFLAAAAVSVPAWVGLGPARAGGPAVALGPAEPFRPGDVIDRARAMAARAFVPPPAVPEAWTALDYDQYRNIRFRADRALWRGTQSPFEAQLFAPGFYFRHGARIAVVDNGEARPVRFERRAFRYSPDLPVLPDDPALDYSGFRLHGALNRDDYRDEFAVFQGASYFRAVARGQVYGLSARALALGTAEPEGEEFPFFRAFWIETPARDAACVRVHALLDSQSIAGAYSFDITPGEATEMAVRAVLFPRRDLDHPGIAPLTSMFLFDATNRHRFDDFRPAVHDSDGLMVVNGNGEQLWRPLANPPRLQVSHFLDADPKGFGLVQRSRDPGDFADLEARYHQRPSAWVEPGSGWGAGSVALVEIPTTREINDNIVAFWRPRATLMAGARHDFDYRLAWRNEPPALPDLARVVETASGARRAGGRIMAIDFAPGGRPLPAPDDVVADMVVRPGSVSPAVIQRNPATGGLRLAFTFDPEGADAVELRAQLRDRSRRPLSEVWLYRWTS